MNLPTSNTSRDMPWLARYTQAENDALVSHYLSGYAKEKPSERMGHIPIDESVSQAKARLRRFRRDDVKSVLANIDDWACAKRVSTFTDMSEKVSREVLKALAADGEVIRRKQKNTFLYKLPE